MSTPQREIAWDALKADANIAKRGVTFAQAATVLDDPLALTVFDATHSQNEERWFTLGYRVRVHCSPSPTPTRARTPGWNRCGSFQHAPPRGGNGNSTRTNRDR